MVWKLSDEMMDFSGKICPSTLDSLNTHCVLLLGRLANSSS